MSFTDEECSSESGNWLPMAAAGKVYSSTIEYSMEKLGSWMICEDPW